MTLSQLQEKFGSDYIYFDVPFWHNFNPTVKKAMKFIVYDIDSSVTMLFKKKLNGDYLVRVINNVGNDINLECDEI